MEIELFEERNFVSFELGLKEKIKGLEEYYEIIDIKYSTCFDNTNHLRNYSALILMKKI